MTCLSVAQTRALAKLAAHRNRWLSPYVTRETRGTLDALVRRNLADRRTPLGSLFFPQTNTLYKITDLGLETHQTIKGEAADG